MTDRILAADIREALAKPKRKRVNREGPIHKACLNYLLLALPGAAIHHSPNETDMSGRQAQRMVSKAKALGMRPGWPDIEVLWRGHFWTFEVKAPGNTASENQKKCGADIIAQGGRWAVVRSVDDVRKYLDEWMPQASEPGVMIPHRGVIT